MADIEERIATIETFVSGLGPVLGWVYEAMLRGNPPHGGGGGGHGEGGGGGKGGGGVASGLPGQPLNHCKWVQVWANGTGAAADRNANVHPATPPNGFPAGSTITVFAGPIPPTQIQGGGDAWPPAGPPAGQGAPPGSWPTIPQDGGAASVKVPAGQALYVHYDKGNGGVGGIRVTVTQSS